MAEKSGVDRIKISEFFSSTLFNAPLYQNYGKLILAESFDPPGFKLKLGLKDVKLALAAAEGVAAPLPLASLMRDHFLSGIARGYGDLDWSAITQVIAENAGIK